MNEFSYIVLIYDAKEHTNTTAPPPSAAINFAYLASPKLAHQIVGDLEDEAVNIYTEFLRDLENVSAPIIAIDYGWLPPSMVKNVDA
ncbi:ubiquinol oxidase (non-electrogenic) [Sarracenia purpurea var. burkii]